MDGRRASALVFAFASPAVLGASRPKRRIAPTIIPPLSRRRRNSAKRCFFWPSLHESMDRSSHALRVAARECTEWETRSRADVVYGTNSHCPTGRLNACPLPVPRRMRGWVGLHRSYRSWRCSNDPARRVAVGNSTRSNRNGIGTRLPGQTRCPPGTAGQRSVPQRLPCDGGRLPGVLSRVSLWSGGSVLSVQVVIPTGWRVCRELLAAPTAFDPRAKLKDDEDRGVGRCNHSASAHRRTLRARTPEPPIPTT